MYSASRKTGTDRRDSDHLQAWLSVSQRKSMKKTEKIFYILYPVLVLAVLGILLHLVFTENREKVRDFTENAAGKAKAAAELLKNQAKSLIGTVTPEKTEEMAENIRDVLREEGCSLLISQEAPEDGTLYDNRIRGNFRKADGKDEYIVSVCIAVKGQSYYVTLSCDFSGTAAACRRNFLLYGGAVGLCLILSLSTALHFMHVRTYDDRRQLFMENFAHELKTPMTSILGYSSMMLRGELERPEIPKALETVHFEAERMDKLSHQMLELFVLGHEKAEMKATDVRELCKKLRMAVSPLESKYGLQIRMNAAAGTVRGNEALLITLLKNLCDNACKATENGEEVTLIGSGRGRKYRFTVVDRGIGISRENINRVKEPYFREDKSRSRRQGGAGLGLTLCCRIAELHGSKLEIQSKKGKGTRVSFELEKEAEA